MPSMFQVTASGPADTQEQARSLLTDAGYFVLSAPAMRFDLEDGEALLSVNASDPDAPVGVIERLGWRHRASSVVVGRATRVGGQG